MTTVVGLYSLRKANLGDCYATYSLECSAVSVSLSPTSRHLLVGLTSRTSRIISLSPMDRQLMAQVKNTSSACPIPLTPTLIFQVFKINLPSYAGERGKLIHRRDINQVDYGHMSLNCIRYCSHYETTNIPLIPYFTQMDPGPRSRNCICNKYWIAENFKIEDIISRG